MQAQDERTLLISRNSARNGFVVASALLFGIMTWQYLTLGDWAFTISTVFFLSQITYWGSQLYYKRVL